MAQWIWGRKYNFLHNMTGEKKTAKTCNSMRIINGLILHFDLLDGAVPAALLQNETRDYIDAGLLNNSPYCSVLRKERDIDLIISLDFSHGDPFMVGLAIIHIEFFTHPSQDVQCVNFIATMTTF